MSGEIKKLIQQACEFVAQETEDFHIDQACGDSPIEKIFHTALRMRIMLGASEYRHLIDFGDHLVELMESPSFRHSYIVIDKQVQFDWGRADFVIYAFDFARKGGPQKWRKLVVECDGHDFHERNKHQAKRDRSRDRLAQLADMEVFRFTGAELWADPWGCAGQVLDWAGKGYP